VLALLFQTTKLLSCPRVVLLVLCPKWDETKLQHIFWVSFTHFHPQLQSCNGINDELHLGNNSNIFACINNVKHYIYIKNSL